MMIGLRPVLLTDATQPYLSATPSGSGLPVLGYSLLELEPVSSIGGSLSMAVAIQHLLGVAIAVALYVLLLRWGVWRWLSALATVPALLDMRVITAEHLVLPQTLFAALATSAMLVVGWRSRPTTAAVFAFGVLLGAASTVLPLGVALLPVAVVVALLTAGTGGTTRMVSLIAVAVGFGLPLAAYVGWQHDQSGTYRVGAISGLPQHSTSLSEVGSTVSDWASGSTSDNSHWQVDRYVDQPSTVDSTPYYAHGLQPLSIHPPASALARIAGSLESTVPVLLAALLLGLAGSVGIGRTAPVPLRALCGALTLLPVSALAVSLAAGDFSWGNTLVALILWPAAGALGLTAVLRGRRGRSAARPQTDEVDRQAAQAFDDGYDRPTLSPVVVVIAAYNEAAGLPSVLERIPDEVCSLATDVLVVDDGSSDETCAAAQAHRVYVVACPVNRGQGAALRLGYHIARTHGASYLLTTDADGQYDTADFPRALAPVISGDADFVTGSRRLGEQHTYDRVRRVGVHVFAWIVSAFVGQRVTDTSFGLRAIRAEATGLVTLNQPQYQSSELLLGMFSHGFTVIEVPGTMHQRSAGSTKKGRNLVYGFRYARVVFGTWWREGCPSPVTETAPALGGRIKRAPERS